jgi:putative phage-type endonuclease
MEKHLIQGTDEWKEFRKKGVGASDAGVILGVNPWKTPLQLYEEKLGLRESYMTERMQRGNDLEDIALNEFIRKTDMLFYKPPTMIHNKFPWLYASLDGIDMEGKNIVEIKCPGSRDHEEAKAGHLPEKYYPQLQHQMEVTNLDMAYYFSFDGSDGVILKVYRDDVYIQNMVAKEFLFWECLQSETPPQLLERDFHEIHDHHWNQIAIDYIKAKEGKEHFEKKEKALKDLLIGMCEGCNTRGAGIAVSKILRKGNIDYTQIPELKDVDLDKYRRGVIELWRISCSEFKSD